MRLIDAETLFDKVGNIKPRSQRQYDNIGNFMNMITNSPTVNAVPLSVIEDIKAEIEMCRGKWFRNDDGTASPYMNGTMDAVLSIIDKHISGVKRDE